ALGALPGALRNQVREQPPPLEVVDDRIERRPQAEPLEVPADPTDVPTEQMRRVAVLGRLDGPRGRRTSPDRALRGRGRSTGRPHLACFWTAMRTRRSLIHSPSRYRAHRRTPARPVGGRP